MKNKLAKLINVKTIVTILLTIVFCILSLKQVISGEQFLIIFTTIIAFYFGTQFEKNNIEIEKEDESEDEFT